MTHISCEVSLYPFVKDEPFEPIRAFIKSVKDAGLSIHTGPMSSHIEGDLEKVFDVLKGTFGDACETGPVVMVMKVSNTCPPWHEPK